MLYRYKATPKSAFVTSLMSDTLFGHFCWAILYREGESFLSDFLESYGNENPAPVLFSSAFISGYLPRPVFPSPSRDRINAFILKNFGEEKKKYFEGISWVKRTNKLRHIMLNQWMSLKNDYSEERLFESLIQQEGMDELKVSEIEVTTSNMISRESGTVSQEGGLFQREKTWYYKDVKLDIYVEINDKEANDIVNWFLIDHLPENGFGADKSVGLGSLLIDRDDTFDPDQFAVADANACLCLSMTSFPEMESFDVYYRLTTKFGKLGGTFAFSSPTGGNPKPFKKPILMYEPGAVFFCNEKLNTKPLLEKVHSDGRIRHCGIPVTLPFKVREDKNHVHTAD
jgi:CRISPR-associated protein Csm4